jgi:phage gp46-like protein
VTDVALSQTNDGGEISVVNGELGTSDGLFNAVYLSLFGGNERDGGLQSTQHLEWWGNKTETTPARKIRSATQHALRSLPAIPANLRRVEAAAESDLEWMIAAGIATAISAEAGMPALNTVKLTVKLTINGEVVTIPFTENWSAQ